MKKTAYLAAAIFILGTISMVFSQDSKEYVISANDVLEISVYDEPDLGKAVRVLEDGSIKFPLLGSIHAAGLSLRGLEERLRFLLAEDYLVNPQVSIFVKEYAKISVLGQVRLPGSYELKGRVTLMQVIALAGGFTETGNSAKVKVIRNVGGREETFNINATDITDKADKSKDIILYPGDVVFVEEYGRISILGQVNKPGSYLLKLNLTVLEAIALAGGFTKIAATDATQVIRQDDSKRRIFKIKVSAIMRGDKSYDIKLLPGDTIVVPESFF